LVFRGKGSGVTMASEYFLVLLATIFFPFILSWDKRFPIWNHKKELFTTILCVAIPFWIWDVIVTERGHWSFNPLHVVGISFFGLPIEEWLFFVVIAFVSIFTWEAISELLRRKK
jgi:lycopene cyclase domain-containing protein